MDDQKTDFHTGKKTRRPTGNVATQTTLDGGPIKETLPFGSEAHVAPEEIRDKKIAEIMGETGNVATPEPKKVPITIPPETPENIAFRAGLVSSQIEEPKFRKRKLDPELKAMDEVCQILEDFGERAQNRILRWAIERTVRVPGIDVELPQE